MADKLSDTLNNLAEKKNGDFKDVTCPSCAAKIRLYAKMKYGYCRFCAGKVSLKDAQSRKFSKQLIDHLSGEEYYTLMQEGEEKIDEEVAKKAVKKGSLTAALDLGRAYSSEEDFETAMHYFEIAKKGGSKDANAMYLQCKTVITIQTDLRLSTAKKLLSELYAINRSELSEWCRESLDAARNTLKRIIEETEESEKRRQNERVANAALEATLAKLRQQQEPISGITGKPVQYIPERSFTDGGPTGCGIGGSFCGCGAGR